MRLFNFTITSGQRTIADIAATSPTPQLIASGVIGNGVTKLDRQTNNVYSFFSHQGDDTDEDPYGNVRVYNTRTVNTSVKLEMSQSFSAPVTGSAVADFIFITDKVHRG